MESMIQFYFLCMFLLAVSAGIKAMASGRLLRSNPEAWLARQRFEQEQKERRAAQRGKALGVGFNIARMFLKK